MNIGHFDFEKLTVFQKAQTFLLLIRQIKFGNLDSDRIVARQLNRAALSISLNIAEGCGRKSMKDRRNFFIIARGSSFECASVLLILEPDTTHLESWIYQEHYNTLLEVTRMLSRMITNLEEKINP